MRRLSLALCLLVLLVSAPRPVWGEPTTPAAETHADHGVQAHAQEEENLEAQPPVQAYYHRAFFGEPWRTPKKSESALYRQAGAVALTSFALMLVLGWQRARRARREAARP